MISIGEAIEKLRKNNQMTYRAFAEVTGFDSGYIYQIEKGRSSSKVKKEVIPNINIIKQICEKTGYDFALFLAETGYLNPDRVCMNDAEADLLKAFRGNYDNNFIEINKNLTEKTKNSLEIGK